MSQCVWKEQTQTVVTWHLSVILHLALGEPVLPFMTTFQLQAFEVWYLVGAVMIWLLTEWLGLESDRHIFNVSTLVLQGY